MTEVLLPRPSTPPVAGGIRAAANVIVLLTGSYLARKGIPGEMAAEVVILLLGGIYGGAVTLGKWLRDRAYHEPVSSAEKLVGAVVG